MWTETTLKHCVESKLDMVFGERVVLLDLDTYNTPAGRPDIVLLNGRKQLIVVELERQLDLRNIEHALIDQAWAAARYWYVMARQDDIHKMHEYYRKYRFPTVPEIPDLRKELGLGPNEFLWNRSRKLVVVVAGWYVESGVHEKAARLIEETLSSEENQMPCEVWVYGITGKEDGNGNVVIKKCDPYPVYQYDGKDDLLPDGPGLRTPFQHLPARLSEEFREVAQVLPEYLSYELKKDLNVYSKANWRNQVVKLCPWGTEAGICFEFSRMDGSNAIKGAHCQLYVCQQRELGSRLRKHLQDRLPEVAEELGCSQSDLTWQSYSYPIKQHRVDDSSPEAIAAALGWFITAIYGHVNGIIRDALAAR